MCSLMGHLGLSGSWDDITEREAKRHLEHGMLGRSVVCRGGHAVRGLPLGTESQGLLGPFAAAIM